MHHFSSQVLNISLAVLALTPMRTASAAEPSPRAIVKLNPTEANTATGMLTLDTNQTGVLLRGRITGLTPGAHGIHVHQFGDCTAPDGESAGPHFNPNETAHGAPASPPHHAGDLGNLQADTQGVAQYSQEIPEVAVTDLIGRAVIVHEHQDDYQTQPTGNSGKRVACGVIGIARRVD